MGGRIPPDPRADQRCIRTYRDRRDRPRRPKGWMTMHDLVIRNALILDGLGGVPYHASLAVKAGKIVEIGEDPGEAAETIDADGLALMPGIIDSHTHYDAQVTWDALCDPSPPHGVTTVVMGNCGF